MDLKGFDLSTLNFNDVGSWPLPVKAVAIVLAVCVVSGAGYYLDTENQLAELETTRHKEETLKEDFKKKQNKAVNLSAYRDQMEEMQKSFGAMLRQLPSKTEVAELLADVSQTGLANGLEFQLFRPKEEVPSGFYAEAPIQIRVTGGYHEFGKFVSDVAALPRIVTMQEIAIKASGGGAQSGALTMEAIAKTYRYLEDGETK